MEVIDVLVSIFCGSPIYSLACYWNTGLHKPQMIRGRPYHGECEVHSSETCIFLQFRSLLSLLTNDSIDLPCKAAVLPWCCDVPSTHKIDTHLFHHQDIYTAQYSSPHWRACPVPWLEQDRCYDNQLAKPKTIWEFKSRNAKSADFILNLY